MNINRNAHPAEVSVIDGGRSKGRIVLANKNLPVATVVCKSHACCVSPMQEHKKRMCAKCLRYVPQRLKSRCGTCEQAWFCDEQCEQSSAVAPHGEVCAALAHLSSASARFDKQMLAMLRLMIEIFYAAAVKKTASTNQDMNRNGYQFEDMCFASDCSAEENAEPAKPLALLKTAVQACDWSVHLSDAELSTPALQKMISQIDCNVFSVNGPLRCLVGHGVYPDAAMFNHSCRPNCAVDDVCADTLTVSTVAPVLEGQELNISYIDLSLPVMSRRRLLQQHYHFTCTCVRCEEELRLGRSDHSCETPVVPKAANNTHEADPPAVAELSVESAVKLLKPKEIKAELKQLGLSTHGIKKDLVARLVAARTP